MNEPSNDPRLEALRQRWEVESTPRIALELAEAYRRSDRVQDGVAVLEAAVEKQPGRLAPRVALGRYLAEIGNHGAAIDCLEQVVGSDPTHLVANKLLVGLHLEQGAPKQARDRLDLYTLLNASDPDIEQLEQRLGPAVPAAAATPKAVAWSVADEPEPGPAIEDATREGPLVDAPPPLPSEAGAGGLEELAEGPPPLPRTAQTDEDTEQDHSQRRTEMLPVNLLTAPLGQGPEVATPRKGGAAGAPMPVPATPEHAASGTAGLLESVGTSHLAEPRGGEVRDSEASEPSESESPESEIPASRQIASPEVEFPETGPPEIQSFEPEAWPAEAPPWTFAVEGLPTLGFDTADSETDGLEAAEPESAEPEAAEPESWEPEAPEPESWEPESPELEAPELESPELESAEPEAPEPESWEPEAPELESPEPESPELESPEPESAELESAELESPELESPELESPELESPELESPELESPELESPELESPELESPELESPELESPEPESPEPESPELESPELESPEFESPEPEALTREPADADAPMLSTPELEASALHEAEAPPPAATGATDEIPTAEFDTPLVADPFGSAPASLPGSARSIDKLESVEGGLDGVASAAADPFALSRVEAELPALSTLLPPSPIRTAMGSPTGAVVFATPGEEPFSDAWTEGEKARVEQAFAREGLFSAIAGAPSATGLGAMPAAEAGDQVREAHLDAPLENGAVPAAEVGVTEHPGPAVGVAAPVGATVTLARLYERQGHLDEAKRAFREVLARDPGDAEALRGLAEMERRRAPLTAVDLLSGVDASLGKERRKIVLLEKYLRRMRAGVERRPA